MGKRKTFWQQICEKLEQFFLEILDNLLEWIKAILYWIAELVADLAEEARIYIIYIAIFLFGIAVYLIQDIFPMVKEKQQFFSVTGIGILIGSIIIILTQVIKTVLNKLGLLEPLIKLRDKIIKWLNLNGQF